MNVKKIIIISCLLISNLLAQIFGWQDNGVPVRQGAHIEWQRTGDVGENGTIVFGWSDTRTGDRDVYAQKVDSNGNKLWGEDGLLVVGYEGRQEDPVMISDDNGGVYVIWSDFRNPPVSDGQPYAQHISSDGTLTWDTDGVPLSDDKLTEYTLNMCKDGNGGVFALWKKKSSSHFASYLNITNNGPTNEVAVISSEWSHSNPSLERAGNGGAVMAWADERNVDKDIYGQRLGFDGTNIVLEWETIEDENGDDIDDYPNGGIPIATAIGNQSSQKVTYYSEEYSVIVWQDERYGSSPDIFATFLDEDGTPAEAYPIDGLPIVSSHDIDGVQQYSDFYQHKKPRVKANADGAFIIWNDFFRPDASGNIYIQKITHENNGVWDTSSELIFDGIAVSEEYGEQSNSRLTLDGNGGVYVVWENSQNEQKDIKIKHLDSDGNSTFDSDGLSICSSDKDQVSPLVRKDGNGGAFSVWKDYREGSAGLYVQNISQFSNVTLDENGIQMYFGVDYDGQLYNDEDPLQLTPKSLYLGDEQTLLFWEDRRFGNQNIDGFNVSTSYVLGQIIDSNFNEQISPVGAVLSQSLVQAKASVKLVNDKLLYHFIGQDINSGENILNKQIIYPDLTPYDVASMPVDGSSWANQKNFVSEYDVEGNLFVAYARELWGPSSIWLQIYNQSGIEILSSPINIVSNSDGQNYYPRELFRNPDGGIVLVYDQNGGDIRMIGINSDGSTWAEPISIIGNSDGQQFQDAVATNDGIFITWKDSRYGNNDIFSQHISYYGIILSGFENGTPLCEAGNDQSGASLAYVSTTNTVTTCWEDFRNGIHWDAFCREVNLNSYVMGDEFILSDDLGDQLNPFLYTSLTNTILVVWEDFRNDTYEYSDIYIQELIDGQNIYLNNGEVVCDAFHHQINPKIDLLSDSENSYLIYWDDMRSSGKEDLINVYSQSYITEFEGEMGCTNPTACNFNSEATLDDGSCEYEQLHCRDLDGDSWGTSEFTFTTCDIEGDIWVTNCDDIDDDIYCESNVVDCAGVVCGDGIQDECGICDGDDSSCWDCAGIPNGNALEDNCGTCDSDSTNDCVQDCSGEWGGDTIIDECGICGGDGMEDFYADWDGDGFGDCTGDAYTVCPNEAESWMSSECDSSLGDINYDDVINILDIVLMVNMILDGEYDVIADINEDGTVNILDIVTLVNWILNNDSVDCNGVIDGLSFIDSCENCIESLPPSWKIEIIAEVVLMNADMDTLVDGSSNYLGADILYTDDFDGIGVDIIDFNNNPNASLLFSFYHGDWEDATYDNQQYYYFTQDIRNHNYEDFLNEGKTWSAELKSSNNNFPGIGELTFNFVEGLSDATIIVNIIGSNLSGTSHSINNGDSIDGIIMTSNSIVNFDIQISNLCY